jgi:hypothetical protein
VKSANDPLQNLPAGLKRVSPRFSLLVDDRQLVNGSGEPLYQALCCAILRLWTSPQIWAMLVPGRQPPGRACLKRAVRAVLLRGRQQDGPLL